MQLHSPLIHCSEKGIFETKHHVLSRCAEPALGTCSLGVSICSIRNWDTWHTGWDKGTACPRSCQSHTVPEPRHPRSKAIHRPVEIGEALRWDKHQWFRRVSYAPVFIHS